MLTLQIYKMLPSYLSGSGVMGAGDVIFEIRPGTYTGQITLNASLANNNKIEFRSSTGRATDVTVQAYTIFCK